MRLAALLVALGSAAAADPVSWDCAVEGGATFAVTIGAADGDETVHCVEHPALAGRAPPCAPDGGFGLSEPGTDEPTALTRDPASVEGMHGWLFAQASPTTFFAAAAETDRTPITLEIAYGTFWRMRMDVTTGEGREFDAAGSRALVCTERP